MNFDRLDAATASADTPLHLNLFDDVAFLATRERIEQDALGFTSWVGRVAGDPMSTVTFTRRGDVVSGQVSTAGRVFQIRSVGPGLYQIDEIDLASLSREHEPIAVPGQPTPDVSAPSSAARPQAAPIVDVLVFFTPAVRARLGEAATIGRIAQGITDTNTALTRSGLAGSVRLVSAEVLPFVETTDIRSDLFSLAENATANQRREALGADLVSLVTEASYGNICGVAFGAPDPDSAFSLVPEPCFNQFSFSHEIGHNLGAGHAPGDDLVPVRWRPYAFGYRSPDTTPRFRTIMAYECDGLSCPRVLHYSSPAVSYQAHVTGTATQDNARALNEALPLAQNFRASRSVTEPPSAPLNPRATVSGLSVFISWEPPATGVVSNYRVLAGSVPGASDLFNGSVGTHLAFSTAAAPATYYVRIVAENSLGASPASAELAVVVGGNDLVPGAPQSLAAQVFGDAVTLTWSRSSVGPTPTSYLIELGSAPGSADLGTFQAGGPYVHQGGVPDGLYYVRVRAQGSGFTSGVSNEVAVRVGPESGCPAPGAPQGLLYSRSGNFITLSWTAPASGTAPFSYVIEAGNSSTVANFFSGNVGPTTTVSASVPSGTYFIRARAVDACGTSAPSMQVSFQVP